MTNENPGRATCEECPAVPREHVIAEPLMRNTAAAIGLAAILLRREDPEAVMVVMPADHVIRPQALFESTFRAAIERAATAEVLLTVGIRPTGPATGYGYIEGGEEVATIGGHAIHTVKSFKEKPDRATAAAFLASGRYSWNSGTFVWKVSTLLDAFRRHLPGHADLLEEIDGSLARGETPSPELYGKFANVPIDIGILEKSDRVETMPAAFEWDDVGSWLAVDRLNSRDEEGNVVRGRHVGIDTHQCIVVGAEDHVIATVGVEDLIIVRTPDATLICPKSRAEDVKKIVERLGKKGGDAFL
ncbi:MAG: mannose-1-phosphate guanylyltransferase [Planctomycetes bacterium]|nr:mannose-1-phosphate guanylyltransferase [Planctomycetota bacterium]